MTADDLESKPWLGAGADDTFAGLRQAFDTAARLREQAGLEFVLSPLRTRDGEAALRLDRRYALSLTPYREGRSGSFYERPSGAELVALVAMLARLHAATAVVAGRALRRGYDVPDRRALEAALADCGAPWSSGPFGEPARRRVESNRRGIEADLAEHARLAAEVESRSAEVITHGEPHPGNLIRADGRLLLIDWDTVSLAPPERDLWLLRDRPAVSRLYEAETGRAVDPAALRLFELAWRLTDLASFVGMLRAPHGRTEDIEHAYAAVVTLLPD